MKSPEKAVWYIEHVIRNKGAKHLNYPQKEIPFYQYHFYDILMLALSIFVVIFLLIYCIIKLIFKFAKRLMNSKSKTE